MSADIGHQIRNRRRERRMSQAELAEKIGTHQQTIEKIEKGETKHSRYLHLITEELDLPSPTSKKSHALKIGDEAPAPPLVGERDLPVYGAAEGGGGALVV